MNCGRKRNWCRTNARLKATSRSLLPSVAGGHGRTLLRFGESHRLRRCALKDCARLGILLDRITRRRMAVFDSDALESAVASLSGLSTGSDSGAQQSDRRTNNMDEAARRGQFPASPRIVSPLCGPGWLACGNGRMASIRSAGMGLRTRSGNDSGGCGGRGDFQLAASEGNPRHYEARLTAGFQPISGIPGLLPVGNGGPWWEKELEFLQRGLQIVRGQSLKNGYGEFRFD